MLALIYNESLHAGSPPEADYVPIQQTIQLSQPGSTQQVSVTIIDDSFMEGTETFEASLGSLMVLVDGMEHFLTPSESARIQIRPVSASVEILDNDGQYYYNNVCILYHCLLYTSPSPRDATLSRMPSSA